MSETLTLPDAEWQSMAMPRASRIAFEDLEDAGVVTRMGDGAYAAGEVLAGLLAAFDRRIQRTAIEEFGAVENRYPSLIPTTVLRRAGYFDAFPQFLMTTSRFDGTVDAPTVPTGHCLAPTVCYHAYHTLAGRQVPDEGLVLTACGDCFRFEEVDHRTLERLWNYTMREVVFLGSREAVTDLRARLVRATCDLVDDLRMAGHLEIANDPFFAGGASAERVLVQRALKLKYELHMPIVDDRTIAVGSFNLHGTKFGEAFDITTPDGRPAYSGCLGIGLERIAYAFLCRHGLDQSAWPQI